MTEHDPLTSVQVAGVNEPLERLLPQLTVPVGVLAAPGLVSVTVAVQVDDPLTGMLDGTHATAVDVDRFAIDTVVDPELVACVLSPP